MRYLSTKSVLWTILFMWEFSLLNNPQKSQNTATCNGPMKIQPFILRLNTNKVQPIYRVFFALISTPSAFHTVSGAQKRR